MPSIYLTNLNAPLTGIALIEGRVVPVFDFESILCALFGTEDVAAIDVDSSGGQVDRAGKGILFAEDSPTIRAVVERLLRSVGFDRITVCTNGEQA